MAGQTGNAPWFNAVTGEVEQPPPPAQAPAVTRWTVKATFRATGGFGSAEVRERVADRLARAGWKGVVLIVSNNGTEGIFQSPTEQTATAWVIPTGAQARGDFERAVSAAFAPEKLAGFKAYVSELGEQVVKPTVADTAGLVKDTVNAAGGFVWSALPWWVWPVVGVVLLGMLVPYVGPLLLARRKG